MNQGGLRRNLDRNTKKIEVLGMCSDKFVAIARQHSTLFPREN